MFIIAGLVLILIFLATFVYAAKRGAPWVPTRKNDVARFLKIADIQPGQYVYDLGCGDGRLICAAAQAGGRSIGLEISLFPFLLAHWRRLFQPNRKHVKIYYQDIWRADLSRADIIYFFLMPAVYNRLKTKLENELKPGAKVIAYVWPIKEWQPHQINILKNYPNLYLYQR